MADYPSRRVPPLVATLAEQNLKMYPLVEGVCRDNATDNVRQLALWAKEYGKCDWAVATGPDFNVIALEVVEDRGKEMIDDMIASGDLEESEDGYNTLCIGTQDGRWRPIFFWKYPLSMRAETPGKVEFPQRRVILHVEEGSVALPKEPAHEGTNDIADCPSGLKEVAFIAIDEQPSDNNPTQKKVVKSAEKVSGKNVSENQKLA